MNFINIILVIIILTVVGGAVYYIYRAKKGGQKCIGCPYSRQCGGKNCGCRASDDK